jgi:methionine synthase I (cobalamin-dependent)
MAVHLKRADSFDIEHALQQRILILDGAMGTMLQRFKLREEDYRGTRLAAHPYPLKNNNDVLCLTRPELIRQVHSMSQSWPADWRKTLPAQKMSKPSTATARRWRSDRPT